MTVDAEAEKSRTAFEKILRGASTQAFDLMIESGIREAGDLLGVSGGYLRRVKGASTGAIAEVLAARDILEQCLGQGPPRRRRADPRVSAEQQGSRRLKRLMVPSTAGQAMTSSPSSPVPEWSVLRKTFIDMFSASVNSRDRVVQELEAVRVGDLGLSPADLDNLRIASVFASDDLTYVFPLTVEYLIDSGITDNCLEILLDRLAVVCGGRDRSDLSVDLQGIVNTAIFDGLDLSHIAQLSLEGSLTVYPRPDSLFGDRFKRWGDVADLTEQSLFHGLGVSVGLLRAIHRLWHLRRVAVKLAQAQGECLPAAACTAYTSLIQHALTITVPGERERQIVEGRLGLLGGKKRTLEELANELGLTRERVRQVEARAVPSFKATANVKLAPLWHLIGDNLANAGGVMLAGELSALLAKQWMWQPEPCEDAIANLAATSDRFRIVGGAARRIVLPTHPCTDCGKAAVPMVNSVMEHGQALEPSVAMINLRTWCVTEARCPYVPPAFSVGFLHHLCEREGLMVSGKTVYSNSAWLIRHGNRSAAVRSLLLQMGRSMHWSEVAELLEKNGRNDDLSQRNVLATLLRLECSVPWGRGRFIHREHVRPPLGLLSEIASDIAARLLQAIPYLSIGGIFAHYRDRLLAVGIPNATALYSCLRVAKSSELAFPEYPYVTRKGEEDDRVPVPEVLEKYVSDQDGVVTTAKLRDFAQGSLLIPQKLLGLYLYNIPGVLRLDRGKHVHAAHIGLGKNDLAPIVGHLDGLLEATDHVSIQKLFDDKRVTCKMLGIANSTLLFSLLQMFYTDRYTLRSPSVFRHDASNEGSRMLGVGREVAKYVREEARPCSLTELTKHFVEGLGYSLQNVYSALLRQEVVRYSEATFVHIGTLAWHPGAQTQLENIASAHILEREEAGHPYGLISVISEYANLPPVPTCAAWTSTLVGELLTREGRFRLLGPPKNAFVGNPNSHAIENLADLLDLILRAKYDGAARLDCFLEEMISAGVLKKSLTEMMLGDGKVVLDGTLVMSREVLDYAKSTGA